MDDEPIALSAYERLAEAYARVAECKAENGFTEHPAMRKRLGPVQGKTVLDAGCGPGFLADHLVRNGACVEGVDVSPAMLALARKRVGEGVRLHLADLGKPWAYLESGRFDVVASSLALDYVLDWSVPCAECFRVLKPGGRFVFTVQHPVSAFLWYKLSRSEGIQRVEAEWSGFGAERVVMPDYYRSLAHLLQPAVEAGFHLSWVEDVLPVDALKERDPAAHERLSQRPAFLLLEYRKPL